MIRYKRIKDFFFMDTFFATKKGGPFITRPYNTCCQLFVTDKGFIYVVLMKKKSEVLLAIKQFAKEIGAPDSFVNQMIQPYPETTQTMIGCSGTKGSRTFSSWIPSLQPRKVAHSSQGHTILVVNFLSLIKDSFMLFQ